jgi:UPF0755 protein
MKTISKYLRKYQLYLALFPIALGLMAGLGWSWWRWASSPPISNGSLASQTIRIPQGSSADQVGWNLEKTGIIRSAIAWKLWVRWLALNDPVGGVKAGTYELSTHQPLVQVAAKIWQGEVVQQRFVVLEGWSLKRMAAEFEAQGFFPAQDFLAASRQIPHAEFPWLPSGLPHLEGFLYPDTYQLAKDQMTPHQVIHQMLSRFEEVALPLYQKQAQQNSDQQTQLTLREWVALSSIVEKEAVLAAERPRIAGVFLRRLKLGIPLGADPTVEYGLNVQQTADHPLSLRQVKTPSPYNTYINAGLPPTPIASPGLASLKAVLAPEITPYLYFMARYDGTHIFSRTLAEHETAQRLIRRQQVNHREPERLSEEATKH